MELDELVEQTTAELRSAARDHAPAVLANAFGPESMVMTHLIATLDIDIDIFSIDTGRIPEETHALAHSVRRRYGDVVRMVGPDAAEVEAWTREHGQNGFYDSVENRHGCCGVRKVKPLQEELKGKGAWLSGVRREHSTLRSGLEAKTWDPSRELWKIYPMLEWSTDQVWAYTRSQRIPYNKLFDRGFTSIGCAPCTRAISVGEDMRAGRWWWELDAVKECGLHLDPATGAMVRGAAPSGPGEE